MMSGMGTLRESVDLIKLKTDRLIGNEDHSLLLQDDIWGKGTLILKSGVYLTEEIINKLLKFGIKRVNITVDDSDIEEIDDEEYQIKMEQFIVTQNILIIEKNLVNASLLVRQLIDSGFKEGNIFVTREFNSINRYFRAKQINFLFIDKDLYQNCIKCVEKYTLLKNTHTFILANAFHKPEFKKTGISKIQLLEKPEAGENLNKIVLEALNKNYSDFWNEEEILIS